MCPRNWERRVPPPLLHWQDPFGSNLLPEKLSILNPIKVVENRRHDQGRREQGLPSPGLFFPSAFSGKLHRVETQSSFQDTNEDPETEEAKLGAGHNLWVALLWVPLEIYASEWGIPAKPKHVELSQFAEKTVVYGQLMDSSIQQDLT